MFGLLEKILDLFHIKNNFILFNRWVSDNPFSIVFLAVYIGVANIMLMNNYFDKVGVSIGVSMYLIMVSNFLLFTRVGFDKFDWSKYNIPKVGEQIIFIKELPDRYDTYMEGAKRGDVYTVIEVKKFENDYYINLCDNNVSRYDSIWYQRRIGYLKTKKYWTTKEEIRDFKIKKIIKKLK